MDFEEESGGDIPTRPMRVKILYTFDHDSKTNCLARVPDVLNIPAVAIEEGNEVGVIGLKQCLHAITSASPEILSRLSDGDFTIYAHDYSENDTPLVGQGLLSVALATTTPSSQQSTMITGRVCANKLALFGNGVKETLEVKLRLTPVHKPAGGDMTKSMDGSRPMSPAMSGGFDPNAWNNTQQGRNRQDLADYFNFDTFSSDRDMAIVDDLFSLESTSSGGGSGGQQQVAGIAETPSDPAFAFNPAFSHSAPGSRAASPIIALDSSTRNDALRHHSFSGNIPNFPPEQSRPASRASARSECQTPSHQRQASAPSLPQSTAVQQTEVYFNEDGQPRKRAKVMQADWRGRSSFGSKSSDLRVTAATTASMQMRRPIAKRASAPGSNLEPPPRVPTPVPQRMVMLPQGAQQGGPRRSLLRQASTADSDFMSDFDNFSDAIMSSPEEESPGNSINADVSPQEIPSSPPVFLRDMPPQPSSPGLPSLPPSRFADSGYMSERGLTSGNVIDSLERDEDRSPDAQDYDMAAQYRPRRQQSRPIIKTEKMGGSPAPPPYPSDPTPFDLNIHLETPGDMNELPQKMLLNSIPPRREGSQGPSQAMKSTITAPSPAYPTRPNTPAAAFTPFEQSHSRRGSLALPPNAAAPSSDLPEMSQKAAPRRQSVHRSRTTSNDSEAGSPAPSEIGGRPKGPTRSGSGAQRRKKMIYDRLHDSIAKGEAPQFCVHCGAIETPTWRRLYVKECTGKPSPLDEAEGEGETIGVEVTETDKETDEPIKFVIRKSMKKTKDSLPGPGFEAVVLCNPCGLWFNKFRNMRPRSKWTRVSGTRKSKKQRLNENGNESGLMTDSMEPGSDSYNADRGVTEDREPSGERQFLAEGRVEANPPPVTRPRANSMQGEQQHRGGEQGNWKASRMDARAVQSSPGGFHGSQQSPIEIEDLTPKPTRRLLFPSPKREGEMSKSLEESHADLSGKPSFSPKQGMDLDFSQQHTNVFEAFTIGKENVAPPLNGAEDDLAYLFEGSPSALFRTPFKTPSKPTPRSTTHADAFTTPQKSSRKRKPLSPNPNAANHDHAPINDFMTSPASARYWFRTTPSRLDRTPGRVSDDEHDISPWSRQLAQMLSDANDPVAAAHGEALLTSPSRQFDFSDLPTFETPGRLTLGDGSCDWEGLEGILSSDFASYEDAVEHESGPSS